MLVESAIRNLSDTLDELPGDSIDWLDLTWLECKSRFARKYTRGGQEVRLLLRLGQSLKQGDLLGHWPDGRLVVVHLLPAETLVIRPKNDLESIASVFQLGNLHVPIEVSPGCVITPHTSEVEAMLIKFQIGFETEKRKFQPTHWPDSVRLSPNFRIIRKTIQP